MPTYTLRPNANWSGSANFVATGAATIPPALSDDGDGSFIRRSTSVNSATYQGRVGTTSIPATEQIVYVNLRVRMAQGSTGKSSFSIGLITDLAANTAKFSSTVLKVGTVATSVVDTSLNLATTPTGRAWTSTDVSNLLFGLTDLGTNTNSDRPSFYEVYVDVVTTTQSTVAVTAPTGAITDTSYPTVTWTFTDTEGDQQSAYRVKIFDAATYSAGGFSADSSVAAIDTGIVNSASTGYTLTSDLTNSTTYRAYVQAASTVNGTYYWSPWAYTGFSMSLSAPADPTVSAFFDSSNTSVTVSILGSTNFLSTNQASLESATTGWVAATNCAITRSTAQAALGSASLALTASASGTMTAATTDATKFAVAANVPHSARAEFRAAATGRVCRVGIQWLTSAGTSISTVYGSTVTDSTSAWTTATVTATSPANAAYGRVFVEVQTADAAEVHYVDKIAFHPGSTPTWSIGGYYDHSFVVERSTNGTTWSEVRSSPITASTGQTATLVDYEAPISATVTYRAKARAFL